MKRDDIKHGELAAAEQAAEAFVTGSLIYERDAADIELPPVPEAETMVVRSLRLPLDLDQRIKAVAKSRGVGFSTLIREWLELELAALGDDQPISRADALRALAALRPVNPNHAA